MSTAQVPTRRPGVVSFIGVILYIQGFLSAVLAVSMLIWRSDILDYLDKEGSPISDGSFTATILAEAIIAVLLIIVANGIMRGSNGMRLLVAIVQALSMASAVYILVAHHTGGLVYHAVFSLFVGVFILWALYGHDESDRFFETNG
jgi:O-antigen/teichoic acid export membrane protein